MLLIIERGNVLPKGNKSRPPLIFFGWWTVLVGGVLSGLGMGFTGYGLSVFFKDLSSDLGLNRATTSLAAGIGRLEGGLIGPLTGWLSDKFGPKWPIIVGLCITGTGLILMRFITAPWQYFVVWGVMVATGVNLGLTIAFDKALINWFVRKRGIATGIRFALLGILGVGVLQVVTLLVLSQGWRMTCFIWGFVMLAGVAFIVALVKQQRPEYYGLLPDGAKMEVGAEESRDEIIDKGVGYAASFQETEYTFRQALRTRAYWMLAIAYGLQNVSNSGFTIHIIPFLTDRGIDLTTASSMMGVMVFSTIPARFLSGLIADRLPKNRLQFLLVGAGLIQAVGLSFFLICGDITSVYVMLVCLGLGSGAATPSLIVIIGRYFGRKAWGSIAGSTSVFRASLAFVAPVYTGWIYDTTGSYIIALITFTVVASFSILVMIMTHAPKSPSDSISRITGYQD
ncbi:MFS transporter [Chloroflexota bacterium]